MTSGARAYLDLVFREQDCYGTWPPGTALEVGEIGRLSEAGTFLHTGHLKDRAAMPKTRTEKEPDQVFATSGGVSFRVGGELSTSDVVAALSSANAGLDIVFRREDAAAMILQDVTRLEFRDEREVRSAMTALLEAGNMEEDEILVTFLRRASSGMLAMRHESERSARVSVGASIDAATIQVAKVDGRFEIASMDGTQSVVVARPDRPLTPMYRALVFRRNRKWWSFWQSSIAIGSAIPTRRAATESDIASSRPSLARPLIEEP